MDPGTKKTTKTPKNDEEDNPGGSSLKESKARRPTKGQQKPSYVAHLSTDLGKKDAAESTREQHIQMGAKTIAKPNYNPSSLQLSNKEAQGKHGQKGKSLRNGSLRRPSQSKAILKVHTTYGFQRQRGVKKYQISKNLALINAQQVAKQS